MKNKIIYLILFLISLLSVWRLFQVGYPSMQDDMQIFRLEQFDQCLKDGQIPCRYIADGGLGYGYPLYNFYSPLPYSVAEIFHLLGFSFINSIKISLILPAFIRTFGMYFLATAFFGSGGGILSTVLFAFAPYQALNTFVRGAIAENWALSLLPFIFWSLYKRHNKLSITFLIALFLSHNLTIIYALPLLLIFSIFTKNFKYSLRSLFWSFCITSFFVLPAFFEKNLTTVNTMTQGYFSYVIHFTTLKELFVSNFWGYAGSMWGPIDGLSFNIGLFQWLIPSIIFIYYFIHKNLKNRRLIIALYLIAVLALFLTHSKSTFIWQLLPFMAYFQFPWRFLAPVIFCFSFIGGGLVQTISAKYKKLVLVALSFMIIFINLPYFQEDIWYPNLTDSQKLTPAEITRQSGAGLMDYWPKYGKNFPTTFAPSGPIIVSGQVSLDNFSKNSRQVKLNLLVITPMATLNLPVVYFPNWELFVDNQKTTYQIEPKLGLIQISLAQGQHQILLNFVNTPLRTIANSLSLLTLLSFIIFIIREKRS
ncbi:MAG: hypothetical protein WC784_00855 [Candidatus Shapirobacteria bacterium]|jgi:hypothetical protein